MPRDPPGNRRAFASYPTPIVTMGWLLFLVIAALTFILFKTSARRVYYGG